VPGHPHNVFIFGGKESMDVTTILSMDSNRMTWLAEDSESHMATSVVNFMDGTIEHFHVHGTRPEPRYAHCVIPVQYSVRRTQIREEHTAEHVVLMMMYGGLRTGDCGYCTSHIHELLFYPIMNQRRNAISFERIIDGENKIPGSETILDDVKIFPDVQLSSSSRNSGERQDMAIYRQLLNSSLQDIKKALTKPITKKFPLYHAKKVTESPLQSPAASPPGSPVTIGDDGPWNSHEDTLKTSTSFPILRPKTAPLRLSKGPKLIRPQSSPQLVRPSTAPSSRKEVNKNLFVDHKRTTSANAEILPAGPITKSDFIPYLKGKSKIDARESFMFLRSLPLSEHTRSKEI
jgi:hypothetical protein